MGRTGIKVEHSTSSCQVRAAHCDGSNRTTVPHTGTGGWRKSCFWDALVSEFLQRTGIFLKCYSLIVILMVIVAMNTSYCHTQLLITTPAVWNGGCEHQATSCTQQSKVRHRRQRDSFRATQHAGGTAKIWTSVFRAHIRVGGMLATFCAVWEYSVLIVLKTQHP